MIGSKIHDLATKLWKFNRSITGNGVRQTLKIIQELIPGLVVNEIPTGTLAFDWEIPMEWNVESAYIIDPNGKIICDFSQNNLHLVGYSAPIDTEVPLSVLQAHLHSLPDQPNAIPYVTSYYEKRWGFCIAQHERDKLIDGNYKVKINSEFKNGSMTYGELYIKGHSDREVLFSTYVCHPSMANNELSGPCVTAYLAMLLQNKLDLKYSYRFLFIPETIGSIAYISQNIMHLKCSVMAGFNVTCVGDNRTYSYLPSRNGRTLSDQLAKHVLKHIFPAYKSYSWKDRGSDERQYCAPGVDLPMCSIMRSKYGTYDEYHTSLDDLVNVVTPDGLYGAYHAYELVLEAIERFCYPVTKTICEPNLGRRGLNPTLSTKYNGNDILLIRHLLTWSDGTRSLVEIADLCECPVWDLYPLIDILVELDLVEARIL